MTCHNFEALALQQLSTVQKMALHLSRQTESAADLVQETYLRAFKAEKTFELRDSGIRPWLLKILRNVFYTTVGKQRKELRMLDALRYQVESDETTRSGNRQGVDWEQVDDRVKWAIGALDARYRDVLLFFAVEGLKYREIAHKLDIPIGTVMSRLYRTRAVLSGQLSEMADERGLAHSSEDLQRLN